MRVSPALRVRPLLFTALLFLALALLASRATGAQSIAPSAARPAVQRPIPPQPPALDQELGIAYWTTETGWTSELQLRNNAASQDVTVTPVLRLADGAETALGAVTIKPQEVKSIDLGAAISAAAAPQLVGTYGSLVLHFRSPSERSLYAAEMIHETGHPVAFHIDAMEPSEDIQAGSREGIWWLPNATASDYLIVTNQGKNTLPVDLSLYDASGKEHKQRVLLGRYETTRYSVRKLVQSAGLAGSFGGIKVSAAAHAGSLDTLHFLFDESVGFSAILKMFDYDPRTTPQERDYAGSGAWTLRAPMLALSSPDPALAFPPGTVLRPQLFVRNITPKPLDAALRFNWRTASTTGKAPGPQLHLLPYETRLVNVSALQDSGILPKQANWASVTITTNALPDEITAIAASYDQSLKYGAQTPFSDQLTFQWEGGMWEYDPYHNSIITAGNGGTKPTQAAFTIFYNQGTQRYDLEQTLQPDEQMWIDVGKLIREQVPDKKGKALPMDLASGSYEFRDLTHTGVGTLFEGKIIYDKTYGNVAYGCGTCCGYSNAYVRVFYNPLGVPLQSTEGQGVNAYQNCTLTWDDVSDSFWSRWASANTGIATVDYYGTHNGVSVGSTTSNTSGYLAGAMRPPTCPQLLSSPNGGVNTFTTPSQHDYPMNPLPSTCWISQFFDHVTNAKAHRAQDVVYSNSTNNGGIKTGYGTYVYAAEGGTVVAEATGNGPAAQGYPTCAGQGVPANYVKIKGSDGYFTVYVHVTPTVNVGDTITQGQKIGVTDNSGCQSGSHIHMVRKDPNNSPVNFTIPCVNKLPTNNLWDGLVNDDVPDNL